LFPFAGKNNVRHWSRLTVSIILSVSGKLENMEMKKQEVVPGMIDRQFPKVVKKLRMTYYVPVLLIVFGGNKNVHLEIVLHLCWKKIVIKLLYVAGIRRHRVVKP
jgi:hypothetical protein